MSAPTEVVIGPGVWFRLKSPESFYLKRTSNIDMTGEEIALVSRYNGTSIGIDALFGLTSEAVVSSVDERDHEANEEAA